MKAPSHRAQISHIKRYRTERWGTWDAGWHVPYVIPESVCGTLSCWGGWGGTAIREYQDHEGFTWSAALFGWYVCQRTSARIPGSRQSIVQRHDQFYSLHPSAVVLAADRSWQHLFSRLNSCNIRFLWEKGFKAKPQPASNATLANCHKAEANVETNATAEMFDLTTQQCELIFKLIPVLQIRRIFRL